MLLCYIDESGRPVGNNTSHYVLAGVSIPVARWKACDKDLQVFKKKWELDTAEIHTGWMLRNYKEQRKIDDFSKLNWAQRRIQVNQIRKAELIKVQHQNHKLYHQIKKNFLQTEKYIHLTYDERYSLLIELSSIIGDWGYVRLYAECIDMIYYDSSITGKTIEEQAFEQVVSRFEKYLQNISNETKQFNGLLIYDNNQNVAKRIRDLMVSYHKKGTGWIDIQNIVETPLFVDSTLTSMIQIADLCSYSLRKYLETRNENDIFKNIMKRADVRMNKLVGVRHYTKKGCDCLICKEHNK